MSKVSNFLIGLMVIFAVLGVFSIATSITVQTYANYDKDSDYNESFAIYNKTHKVVEDLNDTKSSLEFTGDSSWTTKLENLFGGGYSALQTVSDSADLSNELIDQSIDSNPLILAEAQTLFKVIGFGIVLIIIIFILISTLVKRES